VFDCKVIVILFNLFLIDIDNLNFITGRTQFIDFFICNVIDKDEGTPCGRDFVYLLIHPLGLQYCLVEGPL